MFHYNYLLFFPCFFLEEVTYIFSVTYLPVHLLQAFFIAPGCCLFMRIPRLTVYVFRFVNKCSLSVHFVRFHSPERKKKTRIFGASSYIEKTREV